MSIINRQNFLRASYVAGGATVPLGAAGYLLSGVGLATLGAATGLTLTYLALKGAKIAHDVGW